MWSSFVVFVLMNAVTCLAQDESSFYVDDGSGNQSCRLATPRIEDYKNGSFYVNSTKISTHMQYGEQHRVGYVKTVAAFDYVGCTRIDEHSVVKPSKYIANLSRDIGMCYSFCQTNYFGISKSDCSCFTPTPPQIKANRCDAPCNDGDTWCGGNDGSTSIYQTAPSDELKDDNRKCSLHNTTAGRAVWDRCSMRYKGLCSGVNQLRGRPRLAVQGPSTNGSHGGLVEESIENANPSNATYRQNRPKRHRHSTGKDDGDLEHVTESGPWRSYPEKCFERYLYPATDISGLHKQANVWLGRIKTEIIKKLNGRHQNEPDYFEEGFVFHDRNGLRLTFSSDKGIATKRLCVNEPVVPKSTTEVPTTTTTTTTTATTTTTTTSTAAATTTSLASNSLTDTSGFTTQSTNKATKSASDARSESASFIGSTYFYIVIGCSALILIAVVVICIRRKRGKANVHSESKHSAEKQDQTPGGGDVTYDVCDIPASSGSSVAPRDTDYDTAATLATHSSRSPARGDDADTSNLYNTTQDFSNDIYDHAGTSKDKPAVFGDNIYNTLATEDLYDHTSSDKTEQDLIGGNIYSTSRTVRGGKEGQVEGTYDNEGGVATQTGGIYDNAGGVATHTDGIYDNAGGMGTQQSGVYL